MLDAVTYILTCSISDHFLLAHCINGSGQQPEVSPKQGPSLGYLINPSTIDEFCRSFDNVNWDQVLDSDQLDHAFKLL